MLSDRFALIEGGRMGQEHTVAMPDPRLEVADVDVEDLDSI